MSDGLCGSMPSPRGPAGVWTHPVPRIPLVPENSDGAGDPAHAADPAKPGTPQRASEPPYPADLAEWHDSDYPSYMYDPDFDRPQSDGALAARGGRPDGPPGRHQAADRDLDHSGDVSVGRRAGRRIHRDVLRSPGSQSNYTLGTVPPAHDQPARRLGGRNRGPGAARRSHDQGQRRRGHRLRVHHPGGLHRHQQPRRHPGRAGPPRLLQVVFSGGQGEPGPRRRDPYSDIAVIKAAAARPTCLRCHWATPGAWRSGTRSSPSARRSAWQAP